jgi:methionine biosynthesis protein MetW
MPPTKRFVKGVGRFLETLVFNIPGVDFLILAYREIRRPAPLEEFADYDEYWHQRSTEGLRNLPHVMLRYDYVTERIPDGARVLDVGCGDGGFLAYLKKHRPRCEVVGADVSERSIQMLREQNLEGVLLDRSRSLREQIDRSFDFVVLMEVLEHIVDAESLMRQVCEFKPRRIFVSVPNMGFIFNRLRLMFGGRMPITVVVYHMREHVRFWTLKDFYQWAEVMGLEVTHVIGQHGYIPALVRHFPALFARAVVIELAIKNASGEEDEPARPDGVEAAPDRQESGQIASTSLSRRTPSRSGISFSNA